MRIAAICATIALALFSCPSQAQTVASYDAAHVRELISAGQFDTAQAILDAAFKSNRNDPELFNLAAQIRVLGHNDYENGVSEETAAITLDPTRADFYYERGLFRQYDPDLWMESDMGKALADFSKALELRPEFPAAAREQVEGLYRLHHDCADTYYPARNAARSNPKEAEIWYLVGVCELWKGDDKASVAGFNTAIANGLTTARTYEYRGYAYSRLGNKSLALADYQKAAALDPDVVAVKENLLRFKLAPKRGLMPPAEITSWAAQMRADWEEVTDNLAKADHWRTAGGATPQETCGNLSGWAAATHNAQNGLTRLIASSRRDSEKAELRDLLDRAEKTEATANQMMAQSACSF